jgi:hypothetical protein
LYTTHIAMKKIMIFTATSSRYNGFSGQTGRLRRGECEISKRIRDMMQAGWKI